jgi:signal transduction histidine kinase
MLRQLRGLRAQLLLWTILPLGILLAALSIAGIARHRQAMTDLIEERDRSVTLASANRLSREIDRRVAELALAAAALGENGSLPANADGGAFPAGLAALTAEGEVLDRSPGPTSWPESEEARVLAARTAAVGRPQFEGLMTPDGEHLLLAAAPAGAGRVLAGAIPAESLPLDDAEAMGAGEDHPRALFVLDATGRRVHHAAHSGPDLDAAILAGLPAPPAGEAGTSLWQAPDGREWVISYARVDPPRWTLVNAEDVRAMASMGMSYVEVLPGVLLGVALLGLLGVSFGVANLVRPLQELDRRAARVAWGDFDAVKAPVGGVQEMEDLRATLAQMADRIRAYQNGMRDYLSAVTQAQEEERARLAHELHDDTVQSLIALKQRAQMARKALGSDPQRADARLEELERMIDRELGSLRDLIGNLRPIYLEDLGFVPALEMMAQRMKDQRELDVTVEVRGEEVRLAPDLELAAFRIVQQALDNVAAHAQAQHAEVTVAFAPDALTLTVRDDGKGFIPPEQPADLARQGHFGLMGMHERAMLYGGQITIASAPGQGATITATLPVR